MSFDLLDGDSNLTHKEPFTHPKGLADMPSETILPDDTFDGLCARLAETLRLVETLHQDDVRRLVTVPHLCLGALLGAGLDLGAIEELDGLPMPTNYGALLATLLELEPCMGSGRIEAHQIADTLGAHDVWPSTVAEQAMNA